MSDSILSQSCANCASLDSDPLTPTGICINPKLFTDEGFTVAETRTICNAPDEHCSLWSDCFQAVSMTGLEA